jgi:hypothetical protein
MIKHLLAPNVDARRGFRHISLQNRTPTSLRTYQAEIFAEISFIIGTARNASYLPNISVRGKGPAL